jgi:hypothetical protein
LGEGEMEMEVRERRNAKLEPLNGHFEPLKSRGEATSRQIEGEVLFSV